VIGLLFLAAEMFVAHNNSNMGRRTRRRRDGGIIVMILLSKLVIVGWQASNRGQQEAIIQIYYAMKRGRPPAMPAPFFRYMHATRHGQLFSKGAKRLSSPHHSKFHVSEWCFAPPAPTHPDISTCLQCSLSRQ